MRTMKDSGVAWIGEIPEEWAITKIKHHYHVILGKMLSQKQTNPSETLENYLCAQNITEEGINIADVRKMWISPYESKHYLLNIGDIIVVEGGNVGLSCIYGGEAAPCYIQNALHRVFPKNNFSNRFLLYWMKFVEKSNYIQQITNRATISHYTKEKLENTPLVNISLDEQHRIADYLDAKCAEIDRSMELVREGIDKLKEYKKSVITEAVTKGLDPDVPMKDSGVPWIGKTPSMWIFEKLKNFFTFEKGINAQKYTKEYIGAHQGDFPVYSGQTENDGIMGKIDSFDYDIQNCIFTTTVGAKVMSAKIISGRFNLSQNCMIMKPINNSVIIEYFLYVLTALFEYEKSLIPTYMQPSLRISDLSKYSFFIPKSLGEQKQIVAYLDTKCAEIDTLITQKQALLDKLAEYKKSLIFECVTGKREVAA